MDTDISFQMEHLEEEIFLFFLVYKNSLSFRREDRVYINRENLCKGWHLTVGFSDIPCGSEEKSTYLYTPAAVGPGVL